MVVDMAAMKVTRIFKVVAALAGIVLVGYAARLVAVDPSFRVTATRQTNGSYRFDISPNFIVRTVSGVSIVGPRGTVAESKKQVAGAQVLYVASGLASNDTVTVECGLQYDRIVPSFTTKTKSLVVR